MPGLFEVSKVPSEKNKNNNNNDMIEMISESTLEVLPITKQDEEQFIKRKNEEILRIIDNGITDNITKIHVICFVFNLTTGVHDNDVTSMKLFKENYPEDVHKNCLLILTRCETLNSDQKAKLIADFFQHPKVQKYELDKMFGLGYVFMGCIDRNEYDNANDKSVYNQFRNVMEMRDKFIEKISSINDDNAFPISLKMTKNMSSLDHAKAAVSGCIIV